MGVCGKSESKLPVLPSDAQPDQSNTQILVYSTFLQPHQHPAVSGFITYIYPLQKFFDSMRIRLLLPILGGLFLTAMASAQTTRNLSSFDKIAISGGFEAVILQEGSAESARLEVSGTDVDNIVTEVKGSTLEIGIKKGNYKNVKARITVTYRNLREIANSGSTSIEALSVIKGDRFEIASSGSGDFKGAFDVKDLEIAISGSSDMTLKGKAAKQEFAISGSGDIAAEELQGSEAEVAISGSGNVKLGVDGPVRTSVSGSGRVTSNKK